MAGLDQDHVASPLAGRGPTALEKGITGRSSAEGGKAGHEGLGYGDFDEPGFHGERHTLLGANLQTSENGLMDVCRRFVPGFALTDATRDGWAFGDPDAVLIAFQCDDEFHGIKLASGGWFGQFFDEISFSLIDAVFIANQTDGRTARINCPVRFPAAKSAE